MGRKLPGVLRKVDAPQEAPALLLLGEVEEELDDLEAVVGQIPLPLIDRAVAVLPHVVVLGQPLAAEDLRVHAYDEHLLVVGPVEDPDFAARGQPLLVAAKVVLAALAV